MRSRLRGMLKDRADTIVPRLYRLPKEPLANDILIPAFEEATAVSGAFGWFTSGWIARLAAGLACFLSRDEVSAITFTIAPGLYPPEYEALEAALSREAGGWQSVLSDIMLKRLAEATSEDADPLARHAVDCLAWMVAHGKLRLRIAMPVPGSNYHPKIWLFTDGLDRVAVRGSGNATSRALDGGIEHMDVDVTWQDPTRVDQAEQMVNDWANGTDDALIGTVELTTLEDLHDAVLRLAPEAQPNPTDYEQARSRFEQARRRGFRREQPATRTEMRIPNDLRWNDGPYGHQGEAVRAWEEAGRCGVASMATGAGKTKMALVAATRTYAEISGPLLLVVSAPSTALVLQWREEMAQFGLDPLTPSLANPRDRQRMLTTARRRLARGPSHAVVPMIVTNSRLARPEFQGTLRRMLDERGDARAMLIGDEAHTLGAESFANNRPEFFHFRLGLSATIERQYDDEGTADLFRYFGPEVYTFGLDRAIGFCLTPYDYHVFVAELTGDEIDDYRELTARIGRKIAMAGGDHKHESLKADYIRRRAIIETAASKVSALPHVLSAIAAERGRHRHTLVYTSSKNPSQYESALGWLTGRAPTEGVTETESSSPRRLTEILNRFASGRTEILVAKKVLDEGIDIPQTMNAALLASSTVEREWVQRRGRVLRMHEGKDKALLFDVIAVPPPEDHDAWDNSSRRIVAHEIDRIAAFGTHAANPEAVHDAIQRIRSTYLTTDNRGGQA